MTRLAPTRLARCPSRAGSTRSRRTRRRSCGATDDAAIESEIKASAGGGAADPQGTLARMASISLALNARSERARMLP